MDASNCLGIHCFAEAHACIDLQKKAKDYALQYVVPLFIYIFKVIHLLIIISRLKKFVS